VQNTHDSAQGELMLIAVNFHYVRPAFHYPHAGIHGITPDRLAEQLALLTRVGEFVTAEQVRVAVRGGRELPIRSIMVTFDDGLNEQYEFAWPVLKRMGIPAIFFVNTAPIENATVSMVHKIHLMRAQVAPRDFLALLELHSRTYGINIAIAIEPRRATSHYKYDTSETAQLKYLLNFILEPKLRDRLIEDCFQSCFSNHENTISRELYMSPPKIAELASHGCIGTHAHEHHPLGLQTPEKICANIRLSVACLNSWTGKRPFALSYPYGSKEACSEVAGEIASHHGIEFGFTMERAGNPTLGIPLFLARFDNNDLPGGKASLLALEELFDRVPHPTWYLE
jgi:peptidoglycan/xylan/chitin deacetylase (PgdA/CDA1 family)